MTSEKLAGIIDRAKKAIEQNPVAAAGLGMGVYFGGKIGQEYNAPAAGIAGSVGGLLAGEQLIRRSLKTGDPYKVFGATIVGSMAPVWGAQLSARAFGQPPQNVHKLAAYEAGIEDAVTKIAEAWQRKEGKNPEGGLNAKGRASLRAQGQDIKPPVSSKQAKKSPKAAARRKSFCARMSGMPGPMKDEKGRPTRKALSLRKWDC